VLATDRAGMMESRDGGGTFAAINNGFSHRQIWRLESWTAPGGRQVLAAASRHDKEYGGVFLTEDGEHWRGLPDGLNGADVISLVVGPDGTLLAGATDGLYRFLTDKGIWQGFGRLLTLVTLPSGRQGFRGSPAAFPILECGSLLPLFLAEACFGGAAHAPRAASKLAATQSGSKLPHSKYLQTSLMTQRSRTLAWLCLAPFTIIWTGIRPGPNDPKTWYGRAWRLIGGLLVLFVVVMLVLIQIQNTHLSK
jgi:hypothetical protein